MKPIISLIAALARNRTIGRDNKLPWSLPDDHKRFWEITAGKAFLMGKNSYLAEDRLLSSYSNIILTSKGHIPLCPNCRIADSLEKGIALCSGEEEIFILGGGAVFAQALPIADRMYLTFVEADIPGDAFFPEVDFSRWTEVHTEYHPPDDRHAYGFTFRDFARKKQVA